LPSNSLRGFTTRRLGITGWFLSFIRVFGKIRKVSSKEMHLWERSGERLGGDSGRFRQTFSPPSHPGEKVEIPEPETLKEAGDILLY
jgi:hypothetical protein